MAGCGIVIVVKAVIPKQLFARLDVAQRDDPHAILHLVHFAVRVAGMIQESAHTFAINYGFAVFHSIQVGTRSPLVEPVSLFGAKTRSGIFNHARAFAYGSGSENTGCMNARGTDDQSHFINFARREL